MFKNILFVCVGNICRSPAAEYWARAQLQKSGFKDIQIASAGLHAVQSAPIAKEMQTILDRFKIDAGQHRGKQIDANDIARAEIIFTMETWQQQELLLAFPSGRGKIFSLGKWSDEEIADPYRKDQAMFEHVFELIQKNWNSWQNKLWK
ncbi:MAG: low molecular weight phosphotyrosine protein phosphatase [Gammaproteobacteria bacterium]|nr:low molecular weight phosphotyrosine protein phosphatase [Gammaproteobacteria bacterium]